MRRRNPFALAIRLAEMEIRGSLLAVGLGMGALVAVLVHGPYWLHAFFTSSSARVLRLVLFSNTLRDLRRDAPPRPDQLGRIQ